MTRTSITTAAILALALLPMTAAAQAQTAASAPPPAPTDPDGNGPVTPNCSAEGYRAFDFWLGDWTVENTDGGQLGTNTISRISHGCAVLEHWVSGSGIPGQSLNHFDPATATWHQRWVGGNGQILELSGRLDGASMVLSGEREGPNDGIIIDRVTWTPQPDGSVVQDWQISQDGGESWQAAFYGIYKRKD